MRPNLVQIESFLAVARTLSFRRAAEETFVAQSAISGHVKRLEELLGVELFERDRRRVLLTAAGERVRRHAVAVLEAVDAMAVEARSGDGAPLGQLRVGWIPTVAPFLLPPATARLAAAFPDMRLLQREDMTHRLVAMVQDGELDFAVLDVDADMARLHKEVLFEDAFLLALPADHDLAGNEQVTLAAVEPLDLLLLEDGHCLSDRVRSFCQGAGDFHAGDFRATSLLTLVHMVGRGLGVTLVPEMARAEFDSVAGMRLLPFAPPAPSRRIGMVWRPTDPRADMFRRLAVELEACG